MNKLAEVTFCEYKKKIALLNVQKSIASDKDTEQ